VHDNLRLFDFYNNYCKENNVEALLISLDARKAFDSVSHKYLHKVLASYGFSECFIDTIKLLYNDIKANILVNGYKSVMIRILRSVKQGDALSCALFILCIDPLIRKIQNNVDIKPVPIPRSRFTNIEISSKVAGFADDIGMAINNDQKSIDSIFQEYKNFSGLSGINLNLEKTEILRLNENSLHRDFVPARIKIDNSTVVETVESVTICGICFSNNNNVSYSKNVLDKIVKMEKQLIRWLQRSISVEGKILLVKTFGLSQLTYILQMCEIKWPELLDIERMIFKFLWNKRWVANIAPDRIKRSILKLPYFKGGLQAPDINLINKALKTKQFVRAMRANHPISLVQKYQLERVGYDEYFKCEYANLCRNDIVIGTYQLMCNELTDRIRSTCQSTPLPEPSTVQNAVNVIASTDVLEFLMRKKELMIINRFRPLANIGIATFKELYNEMSFPSNDRLGELSKYILQFFPRAWSLAIERSEDVNSEITYENEFPGTNLELVNIDRVTVKMLRLAMGEDEVPSQFPFRDPEKFGYINICDEEEINPFLNIRKYVHMTRDRFFRYRILQGDVFCNARMYKFKMVDSPECNYCSSSAQIETIQHLLWDCPRSGAVWNYLQNVIQTAYGINYISYDSIIMGSKQVIPVAETLILIGLKLILTKERTERIPIAQIKCKIKSQYCIERMACKKNIAKFFRKWDKINSTLLHLNN
jgi:hypothetical protein